MKLNRLVAVMILALVMVLASSVMLAHAQEELTCPTHLVSLVFDKEEVTTQPTCAVAGSKDMIYKCPVDDCIFTKRVTEAIAATGLHDYTGTLTEITGNQVNHKVQCKNCSAEIEQSHDYKLISTTDPTCDADGKMTYECECGSVKEIKLQKLGHLYTEEDIIEVVEPTCLAGGYTLVMCPRCEAEVKVEETEKLDGHNNEITIVKPTCTEQGYTMTKCKDCGKTEYTDFTDALGHDFVEIPEVAPTCEEDGKEAYKACSRCKLPETAEGAAIPALNHANKETVKGVKATCDKDGIKDYYSCPDCGKVSLDGTTWVKNDSGFKPAVDTDRPSHIWEAKSAKAATCTEDGWKAYKVCKTCGKVVDAADETKGAEIIKATGHSASGYVPEIKATCNAKGNKAYTKCTNCEKTFLVIVDEKDASKFEFGAEIKDLKEIETDKLDHEWKILGSKEPTCTEDGYTGTMYCGNCLAINPDFTPEIIDKLGHIWERDDFDPETADIKVVEPTCKAAGKKSLTCECGETVEMEIPADTEHKSFYIVVEKVEATCTEAGYEKRACALCDYKATVTEGFEALGHKTVAVEEVKPTETEAGHTAGIVCEVCGEIISGCEEIPATGEKEYGKYSIENVKFDSNSATGKVIVTDGDEYDKVYARVTIWFGNDNYVVMRTEVIDGEFEVGYGVNNVSGITVVITTTKNCASVPMSSCNILAAYEK